MKASRLYGTDTLVEALVLALHVSEKWSAMMTRRHCWIEAGALTAQSHTALDLQQSAGTSTC